MRQITGLDRGRPSMLRVSTFRSIQPQIRFTGFGVKTMTFKAVCRQTDCTSVFWRRLKGRFCARQWSQSAAIRFALPNCLGSIETPFARSWLILASTRRLDAVERFEIWITRVIDPKECVGNTTLTLYHCNNEFHFAFCLWTPTAMVCGDGTQKRMAGLC